MIEYIYILEYHRVGKKEIRRSTRLTTTSVHINLLTVLFLV